MSSIHHQTESNPMAKLIKIAEAKDVPPGQAAAFTVEGQRIALFNVEGTYYAIADIRRIRLSSIRCTRPL
jgi:hypothetical protein